MTDAEIVFFFLCGLVGAIWVGLLWYDIVTREWIRKQIDKSNKS
jgi:hypothetical protein